MDAGTHRDRGDVLRVLEVRSTGGMKCTGVGDYGCRTGKDKDINKHGIKMRDQNKLRKEKTRHLKVEMIAQCG